MEILVTAGVYENYVRIREHDRLVQRRIDLPSPLATEVHIDTVGEGSGCAVLQVYYSGSINSNFLYISSTICFLILARLRFATTFERHHQRKLQLFHCCVFKLP